MKRAYWAGFAASGLITISALSGCSGDSDPGTPGAAGSTAATAGATSTAGTGSGTAGSGTAGSGTAGSAPLTGTQLTPPNSYTMLDSTDAAAGTAAPAAYTANACNACHGTNGEGAGIGPEIRHIPLDYAKWVIRNGRSLTSSMLPFDATALPDADLAAIVTWLGSLPKPTTPQGLYKDFCGNCHGPVNPTGGAVPVSAKGLPTAKVNTTVRGGEGTDPANRNGYMPKFDATALTDAELAQINTFLGSTP